ncbi:MAG: malate dehydrogenase [Chloroflexi bacterium GWB2_49_20]|nr:MAG: malate dehydrogenase [Chloroflexi bacterium GWB2_49_20]OGN78975.1 MAG: malate dehydrogenase [Chloroflexi bacterium GWC2_49_37]OGN86264.1 MAG: malate dehydrogenase [Chloroflexi bacterium GWD2_49_16]
MTAKVSIIGAGMTGSTTAHWLAERELADIVLVDIVEGMPQGKALDLMEAMPVVGKDVTITGSNDFKATEGSDIIVITAGLPRKPGMSRDDLLKTNAEIVGKATTETLKYSPNAIYIILTNPLDTMAFLAMKIGKLPPNRVIGQAGILDSARMRTFVGMELGVSVENINCFVLGGHGDTMVPLTRHSNVAGVPLKDTMPAEKLNAIVERTRNGGGEIVSLLKSGSAYYAPSAAVAQMVEAILKDKQLIVPAAVFMQGEYGLKDIFFGAPVQLGRNGIEKIIEYDLNDEEKAALLRSAAAVQETTEALVKLVAI